MNDDQYYGNPEMKRFRGSGLFKEQWFSICSSHLNPDKNCPRCHAGHWHNVYQSKFSNFVYKWCPRLWRWFANRPNSSTRRRLEKFFPNLKK